MEKEINIVAPEGFEIDRENSTLDCIKFKPIGKKRWRDDENAKIEGYYIHSFSDILPSYVCNSPSNYNVFATQKQAKSALAMARISQIMANDKRFGGAITDEEWKDDRIVKYVITREKKYIIKKFYHNLYEFLAFHTAEQRDLFFEENEDLIRDYFML